MYIDPKIWEKLINNIKKIYKDYNNYNDYIKYMLDKISSCIEEINANKSNKVYIITNNAIVDGEIDYQINGIAFSKENAQKLFKEAIRNAKSDAGFDYIDNINDEKWECTQTDDSFKLYIKGEYSSNNYSIEIKEFDISKNLNKESELDL